MLPRSGWIPRRCTRGFAKQAAAPRTLEALEAELRATRAELERTRLQRDILKNFGHCLRTVAQHHARIDAMKTTYSVEVLCAAFGVARSGYYRHLARQSQPGPRRQRDAVLSAWIEAEFTQSRGTYGVPRLHRALHERQEPVSRKRIARLMRERGLRGCSPRRRYVVTTDSRHDQPIAPNRLREHGPASRPDQIWVADITYIRTDEGWLYLAGVKDAYTRRMVGWAMSDSIDTPLVLAAWQHARQQRRPAPSLIVPLRPRRAICQRRLPHRSGRCRRTLQHEPPRQLLRQRHD